MAAPPPISLPRIEGYDLIRPLARGGMGEVFLARPSGSDQTVALKVLTAASVPRFERETELVQNLSHPGLVRVLAHGISDGRRYFVMEYVPGRNLRDLLTRGQPLPLLQARPILTEIAEALIYLELQGIIHRDLKPENVLIDEEGRICLTDFGLCVHIDDVGQLTRSNEAVGTYDYMAPEQRARLPIDARADQFSLAVLAVEMLTGRRPQGRFKRPSQWNPELSPAVDDILFRALQEDPDDRYPDTGSFAEDLLATLVPRRRRRRRGLLVCGALLLTALLAFAIVQFANRAEREQESAKGDVEKKPEEEKPAPAPLPARSEAVRRLVAEAERYAAAHRRTEAIDCYSQAIALAPADPMLLVDRAHSHLLTNNPRQALTDLDTALRLDPKLAAAFVGRGAVHLQERRYDDALTDLTTAIRLDPNNALAHAHRGRLHQQRDQIGLALADLNRAIVLDKSCGIAYHFRALTRQKLQAHPEAIADFRESVRLTPSNPFAHSVLATVLLRCPEQKLRDIAQGVKHAQLACELSAWKDPPMMRLLAFGHAAAGDPAEAIRVCDRALRLRCSDKERKLVQDARARYVRSLPPGEKPVP